MQLRPVFVCQLLSPPQNDSCRRFCPCYTPPLQVFFSIGLSSLFRVGKVEEGGKDLLNVEQEPNAGRRTPLSSSISPAPKAPPTTTIIFSHFHLSSFCVILCIPTYYSLLSFINNLQSLHLGIFSSYKPRKSCHMASENPTKDNNTQDGQG